MLQGRTSSLQHAQGLGHRVNGSSRIGNSCSRPSALIRKGRSTFQVFWLGKTRKPRRDQIGNSKPRDS